jgi:hypothetical protein
MAKENAVADPPKKPKSAGEKGLRGIEIDKTPNANYTVAGVTSGKKTPESERKPGRRLNVKEPTHA